MKNLNFLQLPVVAFSLSLVLSSLPSEGLAQKPSNKAGQGSAASSAASTTGSTYRYNYGMAGCGLGSLIIRGKNNHNSKGMQILAYTLNSAGYQTSALTSGTSNCNNTPQGVARMEQEVFLSSNLNSIIKDAARGEGQHLAAFAEVLGCEEATSVTQLGSLSQERFETIFASHNANQILDRYLVEVNSMPGLAGKCTRVNL